MVFGKGLRTRLLISFLLISLIPFGAGSYMAYRTVRVEAEQSVVREMSALAGAAAETLNLYMTERVSDQLIWSDLLVIREAIAFSELREEAEQTLRAMVKLYSGYQAVMVTDVRGICVFSTSRRFAGENFSQSPLFLEAQQGLYVSDLHQDRRIADIDPDSQGWTVSISVPIKHKRKLIGVLTSFLKWSSIEHILAEISVGKTGYVFMVSKDGKIISHPSRELYGKTISGPGMKLEPLEKALADKKTSTAYSVRNAKTGKLDYQIVGIAHPKGDDYFAGLGWRLVAGADTGETMAFLPIIVHNLTIAGAAIAVLVIAFAFLLARSIVAPITAVARQVTQISEGDASVDFAAMSTDEELQPLIRAIDRYHVMVEERTKELVQANEQLRQEIRDRRLAEEAQRKTEERYRTLFEESKDAILIVHPDGEIIDANPSCSELFGAAREEIVGHDILQFYWNPGDRGLLGAQIRQAGFAREFQWEVRRKDGSQRDCVLNSSAWKDKHGNILGHLSIVRDVTDSRRLQEQLLRSQKMEAVGTLAGGIAHDFNNLLHVIQGYAEMALLDVQETQSGYSELHQIMRAARSAAELTQGLLTFSRRVESRLRPIHLNQELNQVVRMLARTIPKMIDIQLLLSETVDPVKADPAQFQQVVMNLAVNARDAMPNGGKLVLETQNIYLDEEYCKSHLDVERGNYVLLAVTDTGSGMSKKTVDRIFEPFFTTKKVGEGTGLGLAMVYGIVKNHGGGIICYSEPGQGTTFKIYWPALEREAAADAEEETAVLVGGSETILLVDDEEAVRKLGEQILKRFGYTVLSAPNGKEGLEVFTQERERIALIILDLIMPEMSGRECLSEILKIDPATKIIVATGYAANGQIDQAVKEGARTSMRKPFEARQMLTLVRRVLDEKPAPQN